MNVVALTGAGISVASGLPTFADAVWEGRPVRDYLSLSYFRRRPEQFYRYFWSAVYPWRQAQPNPAHLALAAAEIGVITQNIDGLHQQAGSQAVLELHGDLRQLVCLDCGALQPVLAANVGTVPLCPHCAAILKPHVVLFEEMPLHWEEALDRLEQAELLLVVGTSLEVAPACYLPEYARRWRIPVLAFNQAAERELPRRLRELGLLVDQG